MTSNIKRNLSLTGDLELTGIQDCSASRYAAGAIGVKVALEHTFKEMGIFDSMRALAKMNQKDGFDCAGCAWPTPKNLLK